MSDDIRRDIVLALTAEAELKAFDAAVEKLNQLEAHVNRINGRLKVQIPVEIIGADGAINALGVVATQTDKAGSAAKTASSGFERFAGDLQATERELGIVAEKAGEVNRVLASGERQRVIKFEGPGIAASFNEQTGASTIATNLNKTSEAAAARERDAAIKEDYIRTRDAIDRQNALHEDGIRQDVILTKRSADQMAGVRDAANKEYIIREKRTADEAAEIQEAAAIEASKRANFRTSFEAIKQQTGATEKAGPARFTQDGTLVQDTYLFDQHGNQIAKLNAETGRATSTTREFTESMKQSGDTIQNAAGKVLLWTVATGAIFTTMRLVKDGVSTFAEMESATVSLARAGSGFSGSSDIATRQRDITEGARLATRELLDLQIQFGVTGTEAQRAAVEFARLGLSERDVVDATKVALLGSNLSGEKPSEVAKNLAVAMEEFKLSVTDLPNVLNNLNVLQDTTRVKMSDLFAVIQRAGAVTREAGGSFEFLAAAGAVTAQATGRTGSEIGNAFKTIEGNLTKLAVSNKIFEETGIVIRSASGDIAPLNQILGQLVNKFTELNDVQKADITTQIAGTRQRNILQSVLDNYFQIQKQVARQLTDTTSTEEDNARVLDTLSSKAQQVVAAFEKFSVTVGDSGASRVLKVFLDGVRAVIELVNYFGVVGVAVTGTLALFTAAVLVASVSNVTLGGTFTALGNGLKSVTLELVPFIAEMGAIPGVDSAAAAANLEVAGSFTEIAASAALALAPLLAVAAAAAAVYYAYVKISTASDAKRPNLENPDSPASKQLAEDQKAIQAAEKKVQLLDNVSTAAAIASKKLEVFEQKEAAGIALTVQELQKKAQILDYLKQITGENVSTSQDAADLSAQAEEGKPGAAAADIAAQKKILEDLKRRRDEQRDVIDQYKERANEHEKGLEQLWHNDPVGLQTLQAGRKNRLDRAVPAEETAALQAIQNRIDEAEKKLRETLAKPVNDTKDYDAEGEQSAKKARELIKRLESAAEARFILRIDTAGTPPEKLAFELEALRAKIVSLTKESVDIKVTSNAKAVEEFDKQLEKLSEKEDELVQKQKAATAKEKITDRVRDFRDQLEGATKLDDVVAKFQAESGPERTKGVREADQKIAQAQLKVQQLHEALELVGTAKANESDEQGAARSIFHQELEKELRTANHQLQDAQIGADKARFDILRNITKEMEKQQDSLKGLLGKSDEERAQIVTYASKIASGEIQRPTAQQLQYAPAEFNRMAKEADKFFPGLGIIPKDLDFGFDKSAFLKPDRDIPQTAETTALLQRLQGFNASGSVLSQGVNNVLNPPDIAQAVTQGRAGSTNLDVNINGLQVPADKIVQGIALEVGATVQKVIDENVARLNPTVKKNFNAPVRSN